MKKLLTGMFLMLFVSCASVHDIVMDESEPRFAFQAGIVAGVSIDVSVSTGNIFAGTAPRLEGFWESIAFVFNNGDWYMFSTEDESKVQIAGVTIVEYLTNKGREIKDLAIVAHNHLTPVRFTLPNNKTFFYLKELGFNGSFIIYYPFNRSVKKR